LVTPLARLDVVMLSAGAKMERLSVALVDTGEAAESVTFTVKVEVPAAVGVPAIAPVEDNVRPAGNVPLVSVHDNGAVPPVVVSCAV
jgi:hypothetical protein